jgi:hypothetical protein
MRDRKAHHMQIPMDTGPLHLLTFQLEHDESAIGACTIGNEPHG